MIFTGPEPPTVQPAMLVDPVGRGCPPAVTIGNSKLPFANGPNDGGGETGTTETLSSKTSTPAVSDEVSVNVNVELVELAVNLRVCNGPKPDETEATAVDA